jgi:hypothetical protein
MSKFIGILKCRLVDQGIYVNPGEIFEPDEAYERSSRSLAAALRANWMRRISDHEVNQIRSKQKTAVAVEEVNVRLVQPTAQKKVSIEVVTPHGALSEMTDSAIADEVIDQTAIIAARDKKHDQQQLKVETVDSIKDEIRQKTKKALKIRKVRKVE